MDAIQDIEVVLKITERCNIDCTYCYVFNRGDESYKLHPPYMSIETAADVAVFLAKSAQTLRSQRVIVDFHGGEPLMMKKGTFDQICTKIRQELSPTCRLVFNLQTNAMLVDEAWINLFDKHQVTIGVSLDGPKEINDTERIDHKGQGTYDRVIKGLRKLQSARDEGLIPGLGVLVVANPSFDGRRIYRHIVDELGILAFDVLLPINSHDDFDSAQTKRFTAYYLSIFEEWVSDDDPLIYVRFFDTAFSFLRSKPQPPAGDISLVKMPVKSLLLTIASDGGIGPDDSLRVGKGIGQFGRYSVRTNSIEEIIEDDFMAALIDAETRIPDGCQACAWQYVCRGGAANGRMINRYRASTGFNNPSILCDTLKKCYSSFAAHALATGTTFADLERRLIDDNPRWTAYEKPCAYSAAKGAKGEVIPIFAA